MSKNAPYLFVANWKMQFSFDEAVQFGTQYYDGLVDLAANKQWNIVLCPSFPALHALVTLFEGTQVHIGAQNVSRHPFGAYTGEVSARSLAQVGCSYCIIGHSERRTYFDETNIDIEHKLKELLKQHILPIVCIGETKEEYEQRLTFEVLKDQLLLNLEAIAHFNHDIQNVVIAYEPVWSIGTGVVPEHDYLKKIFAWLVAFCDSKMSVPFRLLYGGSVSPENAKNIVSLDQIHGLLIGGASLDFKNFKAIVQSAI